MQIRHVQEGVPGVEHDVLEGVLEGEHNVLEEGQEEEHASHCCVLEEVLEGVRVSHCDDQEEAQGEERDDQEEDPGEVHVAGKGYLSSCGPEKGCSSWLRLMKRP